VPEAVDGDSVLGLLRGDGPAWRAWIDLEHEACYTPQNQWNALTDGRWKYVYFSPTGEEQLFDLAEDPREKEDVGPARPERREELRRDLEIFFDTQEELGRLRAGKGRAVEPSEEEVEVLRSLGYVD